MLTQEAPSGNNDHPGKASSKNINHALKELRKEIQDAKRHREFMGRVAKNEARDLENVIATSEIVTIAVGETVSTTEEPTDLPEVDLHDIFIRDRKGFIVGKKGKIFSFQL